MKFGAPFPRKRSSMGPFSAFSHTQRIVWQVESRLHISTTLPLTYVRRVGEVQSNKLDVCMVLSAKFISTTGNLVDRELYGFSEVMPVMAYHRYGRKNLLMNLLRFKLVHLTGQCFTVSYDSAKT